MNALAHCAEALYAQGHNPAADEHALAGACLIAQWLQPVVSAPRDLEARTELLRGACHGGAALGRLDARARPRDGPGDRRTLRAAARDAQRDLLAAGASLQRRLRSRRRRAVRRGGRRSRRSCRPRRGARLACRPDATPRARRPEADLPGLAATAAGRGGTSPTRSPRARRRSSSSSVRSTSPSPAGWSRPYPCA